MHLLHHNAAKEQDIRDVSVQVPLAAVQGHGAGIGLDLAGIHGVAEGSEV